MFKTPEWEDDVPKSRISFTKKNQKNGKILPESGIMTSYKVKKPKQKDSKKPKLNVSSKANDKKPKLNVSSTANYKKKEKPKPNASPKDSKKFKPNRLKIKNHNTQISHLSENHSSVKQTPKPLSLPKFNGIPKPKKEKKASKFNNNVSKLIQSNKNSTSVTDMSKMSRKRKLELTPENKKNKKSKKSIEYHIPDTQNFDEILLNAKKKKFNEVIENDDQEDLLFTENKLKKKIKKKETKSDVINEQANSISDKKKRLKAILDSKSNRQLINLGDAGSKLRERMLERLKAAQFRYLNEKLYTSSGCEAQQLFKDDPAAFDTYHQGYQLQVKKWPVNPLDVIVKKITKMPKSHLIADMGCGEAALARRVPQLVRSFDLVSAASGVEACDMARTPLLAASMDVVVYCLALMGTDLTQYLVEANRVLKVGGHLLIAEVESRFENVENFTKEVQRLGFKLKQLDKSNSVFYFIEFTKLQEPPVKKAKLPFLKLKPCIYKRR